MKIKILCTLAILCHAFFAQAQLYSPEIKVQSTNGNIGIDIPDPDGKLQINGAQAPPSDTELNGSLILSSNSTNLVNTFGIHTVSGGAIYAWIQPRHKIDNTLFFDLSLNPKGGNVGIGTDDPLYKLDVLGDMVVGNTDGILHFRRGDGNVGGNISFLGNHFRLRNSSGGGSIGFYVNPSGSTIEVMSIANNGNVGIGETNPNYKLEVSGTVRATTFSAATPPWADFVFEENYKLRTLEEVEKYINTYKHLPDIPSEEEVTEKGIDLGAMDAKLLQKIEELTLYLINQHKTIKLLEEKVEQLEAQK